MSFMTKQTQPAESERAKKQKPQVEAVEPQATSENLPQGLLLGSFQAAGRNGSIEGQRALLKDRPWQDAQRQAFAAQISRVQGNRHLQRLIANVRKESGAPGKLVQRQSLIAAIPANLNGVEANAVFRRILTKSSALEQQAAGIPLAELARVLIPPNILSYPLILLHPAIWRALSRPFRYLRVLSNLNHQRSSSSVSTVWSAFTNLS
jgi:hypothetical protein